MPPMNCERAVFGLMMRPAAKTPSMRGTRTSPVSTSTRTSANWAPKAWRAICACASISSLVSTHRLARRAVRAQLPAAPTTAVPHEAVPIEPPASGANGSALSPMLHPHPLERRRRARRPRSA